MQGLNSPGTAAGDTQQPTHSAQTKQKPQQQPITEQPERRQRVDRRRTRNPVFEARARRVGMVLDRRRSHRGLRAVWRRSVAAVGAFFSFGDRVNATPQNEQQLGS